MLRGMVVALLVTQAVVAPVVVLWVGAPVGSAGAMGLGGWGLALLLGGLWAVRRAPTAALLVLLPGLLLTSCTPPVTLSPALQARVAALADRLAVLPGDPETGESGAAALLAAWRARVAVPAPAAPVPSRWEPHAPEEVSNVP